MQAMRMASNTLHLRARGRKLRLHGRQMRGISHKHLRFDARDSALGGLSVGTQRAARAYWQQLYCTSRHNTSPEARFRDELSPPPRSRKTLCLLSRIAACQLCGLFGEAQLVTPVLMALVFATSYGVLQAINDPVVKLYHWQARRTWPLTRPVNQ